jgi:FAD/FMN-containing dehydrogenase
MGNLKDEILGLIKGEAEDSPEFKEFYSHDASMFELIPEVVVAPQDSEDVKTLVKYAQEKHKKGQRISLTARSGGTDMSGAAISESVVLDFSKHFTKIGEVTSTSAQVQPGVFYRDFEP